MDSWRPSPLESTSDPASADRRDCAPLPPPRARRPGAATSRGWATRFRGLPIVVSKLTLEYDGGGFAGWARQPALRTVQDELERALATILSEREPVPVTVAGRTD